MLRTDTDYIDRATLLLHRTPTTATSSISFLLLPEIRIRADSSHSTQNQLNSLTPASTHYCSTPTVFLIQPNSAPAIAINRPPGSSYILTDTQLLSPASQLRLASPPLPLFRSSLLHLGQAITSLSTHFDHVHSKLSSSTAPLTATINIPTPPSSPTALRPPSPPASSLTPNSPSNSSSQASYSNRSINPYTHPHKSSSCYHPPPNPQKVQSLTSPFCPTIDFSVPYNQSTCPATVALPPATATRTYLHRTSYSKPLSLFTLIRQSSPFQLSWAAYTLFVFKPYRHKKHTQGELEQGLPPLKKLKPDTDNLEVGTRLDKHTPEGLVLHTAVKGILTKRDSSSSIPQSPSASSPICAETCFLPWSRSLGLGLTTSNMSTPFHSSTPLSRRSSSGASSACASSLKAVRFASGNGFPVNLIAHGLEPSLPILPREIEGPVAAVMYLTHSAEAYDRSPIVVENGLRLPPRAKPEDEDDEEEQETLAEPASPAKPPTSPEKKRRGKVSVVITKMNQDKLCTSPEAISPQADNDHETSVVIKPLSLSMCRTYREIEEVDEEEDDETNNGPDLAEEGEDEETKPEDDKQQDDDDNSDDDDDRDHEPHHLPQRTFSSSSSTSTKRTPSSCATAASSQAQWGLGKWSSGEVFESCDALGGF
ncbi:hypothetical protein H4Q26_006131 [Puccinia striiformis f. sp. tritici PST-130]|nr:hypothetical protein H4Q26_006131 [Puccinia striiformis f. sp. tritici PST-130]